MNEQSFTTPRRWVLGLTAAASFITGMDGMVVTTVLGSVAPRDMGKASGIYNTMRQLGWACGAAAAVAVFSGSGSLTTAQTLRNGYAAILLLTAAFSITGALLSLKLPSAVRANVRPPLRGRCHRQGNDQGGTTPSVHTAILVCTKGENDDD